MQKRIVRKDLTEGVVWKKLLLFFLPIAAGTCIQQLYNAVDGLIVGRFVGTVALAAVGGSSAQIINLLIGFFVAITSGASVVIAQIYGAGRERDVQVAAGNAIAVFALVGAVLSMFGLVASPAMLRLLQTPEDTMDAAVLYLRIYFLGVPFVLILNMESNMLRAVGDSFSPFLFMVVGCLTNIVLDALFVIVFHWGVAGVAVATVAAQLVNMGLLTRLLLKTGESYRLSLGELRLRGAYLVNMLRLGIPAGLQSSMYAVSNMIIQVGVNSLGTVVVASWAMTSKTDGIFWAVSNALGAAITSFVGQNLGAGRQDRVRLCVRQGLVLSSIITVTLSTLILLLGKPLLHILTADRAVIDTTYLMMLYFVPFYITWVLIEVLSAVLRGVGDAVRPVIIIGLGVCLLRIIWVGTLFVARHTLFVLCMCYPVSWIVTGLAMLAYYLRGSWRERMSVVLDH
ncbi:MAG: MATE family efflux transporter [Oscillospiraceae bacterium]|nr:MATE family efflux transporter [Oscillospiraceae bacterium]